jgi:hypothetical protein
MEKELVNNPKHYNNNPSDIECIEMIHLMSFNMGSSFKYIFRREEKENLLIDLKKARWYFIDEIKRRQERNVNKYLGKICILVDRIIRPYKYDFYFKNFVDCYSINRYESDVNIQRIYELIVKADYYFYDIKAVEDALIHLNFVIDKIETIENLGLENGK